MTAKEIGLWVVVAFVAGYKLATNYQNSFDAHRDSETIVAIVAAVATYLRMSKYRSHEN